MKNYIKENSSPNIRPDIEKLSETELNYLKRLLDELNQNNRNHIITSLDKTESKLEVTTMCVTVFML